MQEPDIPDLNRICIGWANAKDASRYCVFLDGVDVSERTFYASRGEPGTVVQYAEGPDRRLYNCPCGKGPSEVVLTGVVTWTEMSRGPEK